MSAFPVEHQFIDAINAAGIDYAGPVIADGALHRFKANGDRGPNGWYKLHGDGIPAGAFGHWKQGVNVTWCAKDNTELTDSERAERDRRFAAIQSEREADRRRQHDAASHNASAILSAATAATDDHPYLVRKQVHAYPGVKAGEWPQRPRTNCLLIPLRDASGQRVSIQAIYPDKRNGERDKDFLKGGWKAGAFFVIGDPASGNTLLLAEGYATAATLHEATGYTAVMAADAGNLKPVAKTLRGLFPAKTIIICADNDRLTEGNPGLTQASAAANAVNGLLAVPQFTDDEAGSDFNDLASLLGLDAVRDRITTAQNTTSTPRQGGSTPRQDFPQQPTAEAAMSSTHDTTRSAEGDIQLSTVSPCTHLANAQRIVHYYKGRIRYATGLGWILWNEKFWQTDPTREGAWATGFVSGLSRRIAAEATDLLQNVPTAVDSDQRKRLMTLAEDRVKWAIQSENDRVIAAGLKLACHALLINHPALNTDPWLFNVQNGTIDLRTGNLRPHNPDDLITHISPVTYDPDATCPIWDKFINDVFSGDDAMGTFIQRGIGWSLTGVVEERALFFLHGGKGKEGKSTLVETVMALLGICGDNSYGYARKVTSDTFMKSRNHDDNQRKAATLNGPRFICTSEVSAEQRLNEQLIKDITGGDTLEGRRLYHEAVTFSPQFKPWMYGNHKPEIRGTDDAIWSRVRMVPFEVSFAGREDTKLKTKLMAELPGILNWAIRGCLAWQKMGLQPPQKVIAATQAYREEMDVISQFLEACCVISDTAKVQASELYQAYQAWAGKGAMWRNTFAAAMAERFDKKKLVGVAYYHGLGLVASVASVASHPDNFPQNGPIGEFTEQDATDATNATYQTYTKFIFHLKAGRQAKYTSPEPITPLIAAVAGRRIHGDAFVKVEPTSC